MISTNEFKAGMRRLVSGVSLVTTLSAEEKHGTIVTSVTSVSADPPTLLICLNRGNSCHDAVMSSRVFCVNLLARRSEEISRRFASPQNREQRFQVGNWTTLVTGAPVLQDAMASFDCRVSHSIEAHSHTIFLGHIEDIRLAETLPPLLYGSGMYGDFTPAPM